MICKSLLPPADTSNVKISPSSISVADNVKLNTSPSSIDCESIKVNSGVSFTGFTVKLNIELSDNSPSETTTSILDINPLKLGSGIRYKKLFSIDIDTFSCSDTVIVKSSLSISATNISISNDASSSIIWFSISWIEGPSLTGRMLSTREKSCSDKPVPSNTLKTMVSKQFPSVINISGKGV